MTFRPGATLATAATLGLADTSDLGPTAGNGFYTRWPDDLAALQEHGVTDVRLTLDWARLQPRPGVVDDGWVEWYEQILTAADAIGLAVWATMYDGAVPRWFDNEGGLDDDEAFTAWWPRFVERVADRFGDRVAGWIPFAAIPATAPDQPWRDTWGLLGSGGVPVVAAVGDGDLARAERLAGNAHLIGIDVVAPAVEGDERPTDRLLTDTAERWCTSIVTASTDADVPALASITTVGADGDVDAQMVTALVRAIGWAARDGVDVSACFVDPGIAGPDRPGGLLDQDRAPQPALDALLAAD